MKAGFGLLSILAFFSGYVLADSSVKNFDATAKIENTCTISAEDVNFGVVYSPLTSQASNSTMNVHCTNATAYKIDLAYGGVYGSGSGSGEKGSYTYTIVRETSDNQAIKIYNNSVAISTAPRDIFCSKTSPSYIFLYTKEAVDFYGDPNAVHDTYVADTKRLCAGNSVNRAVFDTLGQSTSYAYGVMKGSLRGDNLAYSISVPGDVTKVWNVGNSSYSATGNGESQEIVINAKIVPENSSSKYPAQDMYTDTVTAVIAY